MEMKKILSVFFALANILLALSSTPAYSKGIRISEKKMVEVKNPEGISNENTYFAFGDLCETNADGKVVPIESKETNYFVEYTAPGGKPTTGTQCPSGTMFYIDVEFYADAFYIQEAHR